MPTSDIVLVLTGPDDPTADAVITAHAAHPVQVARIDTGDLPCQDASVCHEPRKMLDWSAAHRSSIAAPIAQALRYDPPR